MRRVFLTLISIVSGTWMVFDGVTVILTGHYFGTPKPGPWSAIFDALGINSFSLGPVFVVLGIFWLVFAIFTIVKFPLQKWARLVVPILTLWYLPLGTLFALITIILVATDKRKVI